MEAKEQAQTCLCLHCPGSHILFLVLIIYAYACAVSYVWTSLNRQEIKLPYVYIYIIFPRNFKKLSVFMLCVPVFIFTSSSSALLGHPRCGLISIWLDSLPQHQTNPPPHHPHTNAISNTLFWVYNNEFREKTNKTRKYYKSAIFERYKDGHRQLKGRHSINTERAGAVDKVGNREQAAP